jgi:hypothetical protein
MTETVRASAPWHFWAIAVLSLLWNAFGCFDYFMTMTRNPGYLAQFPPEMIDFLDTFPVWATVAWAFGVWGSLAGSLLLVLRSKHAVLAFAVSLAGLAISTVYQMTADMPASMKTPDMLAMNLVIWALLLFFLWFAVKQRKAGVLG